MESSRIYRAIGLMSGTSGDGLDVAYCHFTYSDRWRFTIEKASTLEFSDELGFKLANSHTLSGEELSLLDVQFGQWMGEVVKSFCDKHQLNPEIIASHGHTVFHQPHLGFTKQIGCGWSLMKASGFSVINDFRSLDVALGGQGAPLAPIGDHYLFADYEFCLNLGGISNISMMHQGERIAFDVSPFNLLLNLIAKRKGLAFDRGGKLAASGKVNQDFLDQLNAADFYQKKGAKSLGREDMDQNFIPLIQAQQDIPENLLATLVEHYSLQISRVILNHALDKPARLLITGGGAYHDYFIDRLQTYLGNKVAVVVPNAEIIEFKEALIFAFLGVRKIRKEANSFASVTGAVADSCGGVWYSP
ncbi:anhydro-N-acetylmuramic acid kinase [Echinicola sp. CAU 1574]|uniref:Anhydro-N-acetylmuramic acid kinase n=1 Tax=Echinicola arenosa TaxID=2774144 RepID=A0ABR9AU33_9BACT|nr:anhydro-N-acetylmuramic acid kinase [Echinicola arenosa]MBD8491104.1 anhydro-N-acetylmuramic acid kinase [Echinicola arenosa]